MYRNIKPHIISGVLYKTGTHTITQTEYDAMTPEGKALYGKETEKTKAQVKTDKNDKV